MAFNKYYLVSVIVIVFCAVWCNAATYSEPAAVNPAHPGKCFDKITNRPMLPGKEYKPKGICAAMTCDIDAKQINIETCPDIEAPGCVQLPADPRLSFPKCCPQFVCKDENGNEVTLDMTD
ncbi:unnamed protein product [Hermetia illucens]|uniref:Single domain-containing protein n=1 Tax=Hermetia illucens TaxID=343691 RepID=A0A7R8UIU0_HERIL|nr:uncharacterized protein LOC119648306 [Hermetia illucens]CAD7081339.1 unnamed protein product [Hermetia illucens]